MTRIKQAGPPIVLVALIAGVVGYILGCSKAEREQQAQAKANQPETTDEPRETGAESAQTETGAPMISPVEAREREFYAPNSETLAPDEMRVIACGTVKPRMAVAYHFFNDLDTWQDVYDEIRSTYDGPVTLAKDLLCWNVTDDGIKVREVIAQEAVWPAKSPYGTVPPEGDREELPPWLVDGILEMEDVIEAYYERQGVGDLYEAQVPKK